MTDPSQPGPAGGTPAIAGTPDDRSPAPPRWNLIRDALAFQLKLFVDGLRDLAMMPVSIGAAVLDLLGVGPRPGHQFYETLRFGRKTEDWINLFGAASHDETTRPDEPGIDRIIERVQRLAVQEYERGGITASAKNAVDRALDGLQREPKEPREPLESADRG